MFDCERKILLLLTINNAAFPETIKIWSIAHANHFDEACHNVSGTQQCNTTPITS